jgi:hypothetical protein
LRSTSSMRAGASSAAASTTRARRWPAGFLTRRADEPVDGAFFLRRLRAALDYRGAAPAGDAAYRLCWSEADGLPGLVVDRYGPVSVLQCLTLGMARAIEWITDALGELFPGAPVYRLDDATAARIEGFEPERGWIGPAGPDEVIIAEGPSRFAVTLGGGHKTGFYLDQRDNRARVAAHARGRRVLDGFCYTGAFACAALAAGASRRAPPRVLGRGARGRAEKPRAERARRPGRAELGQCLRWAPPAGGGEGAVRPRRPRPPAVHAAQGGRRGGSARLQGDQPPRPPAPRAGWDPRDVLLLPPRHAVVLRGDLPRRRWRCRNCRAGARPADPGSRSPRAPQCSREPLPDRPPPASLLAR